jgi:hypothetical protein
MARGSGKSAPRGRTPNPKRTERRPVAKPPSREGDDKPPVFSFEYADKASPLDFHFDLNPEDSKAVLAYLAEIGRTPWKELRQQTTGNRQGRRKHHSQDPSSVCKDARDRLAAMRF